MAVGNEVVADAGVVVTAAKRPDGTPVALAVDADGKLLVAGLTGGGGSGGSTTVQVDFTATNALLAQVRTATQALLGADSPLPTAQLMALTSAVSAAQTAIVAAQGGTTTATTSVLTALGPLQSAVVAVQTAVAGASTAQGTRDAATQTILTGLGTRLETLHADLAPLLSGLALTSGSVSALSAAIGEELGPFLTAVVNAVEASAGGTDTAVLTAVQQVRDALSSGGSSLAAITAALRTEATARGTTAHTDATAILDAALRAAVKLEAGLSITSPVTLDTAAMTALAPLSQLSGIATSAAAGATAAGQTSALSALQNLKTSTDAITTRLGQTLAAADARMSFDGSGRLTVALDTSSLATAAGQTTQTSALLAGIANGKTQADIVAALAAILGTGGKTLSDVVAASGGAGPVTSQTVTIPANGVFVHIPIPAAASTAVLTTGLGISVTAYASSAGTDVSIFGNPLSARTVGSPTTVVTGWPYTGPNGLVIDVSGLRYLALRTALSTAQTVTLTFGGPGNAGLVNIVGTPSVSVSNTPSVTVSGNVAPYTSVIRNQVTGAALAAGATFTSSWNVCAGTIGRYRFSVHTDQAGSFVIREANGAGVAVATGDLASAPVSYGADSSAGPTRFTDDVEEYCVAIVQTNGSTAQGRNKIKFTTYSQ